ncbi:MAG: Na+/H+ antiporter subunit E [Desulfobacterales bacterium]|nr:Na+/H+ antiporter subunit E [Desulfobacterales bacterium]MCP4162365.1 Na+/H+ antiporter subunit E [Deltaproteobacteria bacterium]
MSSSEKNNGSSEKFRIIPFIATFVIMLTTWFVFSGKFKIPFIVMGVISSLLVAYFSHDLLFPKRTVFKGMSFTWFKFVTYIPWLIYQIVLANLHVLYLVFHPRMNELINPQIIKFKSKLKKDMAQVTFANSITLTPGTITVYLSVYGDYTIHAIDDASCEGLPGEMEKRVGKIFGE